MTQTKTTEYVAPVATAKPKKARAAARPTQLERHGILVKRDNRLIQTSVMRAYLDSMLQKINPKKRFFGKSVHVLHHYIERRLERIIGTAVRLSKHARNKNGMQHGQVEKRDIDLAYQLLKMN